MIRNLCLLGILLSTVQALRALPVREVATGCDTFGYLRSAQMIRRGEPFDVRNAQTKHLISEMKNRGIPTDEWAHAVAPHAYHYIAKADKVSLQYPPGTGLFLALFPQEKAVFWLTLISILAVALGGILLVLRGHQKRDSVAMVASTVIAATALVALERIGFRSYSINALVVPLLLATWAAAKSRPGLAGLLTGLCIFIRVPALFIAPGVAWLGCKKPSDFLHFGLGVAASGILPLAIYNWIYAGAPWTSTYGPSDTAGPSFEILAKSIPFYLGTDLGAKLNWVLILAGLAGWRFAEKRSKQAAFLALGVGIAYFLTHPILIPYYTTPSILAAVGCLLFPLALGTAGKRQKTSSSGELTAPYYRFSAAALVGVLLIWPAQSFSPPTPQQPPLDKTVPQVLLEPHTWVWSDELSGTFLYEFEKGSFKPQVASPRATRALFEVAALRKERQFLVKDIGITSEFVANLERGDYGAFKLVPGGTAFGSPVFELVAIAAPR